MQRFCWEVRRTLWGHKSQTSERRHLIGHAGAEIEKLCYINVFGIKVKIEIGVKRIFKKLILIGITVLILLVAAAAILINFYSERFIQVLKPTLEAKLGSALDMKIRFSKVSLHFAPHLELQLNDLSIAPGTPCAEIKVKMAHIGVQIVPLLTRQILINYIDFHSPMLNIAVVDGKFSIVDSDPDQCLISESTTPIAATSQPALSQSTAVSEVETLPLDINLKKFQIHDAVVLLNINKTTHSLKIAEVSGNATLENGLLNLNSPLIRASLDNEAFIVKAKNAQLNLENNSLEFSSASLDANQAHILIEGKFGPGFIPKQILFEAKAFSLSLLETWLNTYKKGIPKIKSGTTTYKLTLNNDGINGYQLDGNVLFNNLNLPESHLEFSKLALDHLTIKLGANAFNADSKIVLSSFKQDSTPDSYAVGEVRGSLRIDKSAKTTKLISQLNVTDFGFSDGETTIEKASAMLNNINASISSNGDTIVSTTLDADSIILTHPTTKISAVKRVTSPLKIEIPARGGYKVSGPVTINDAAIAIIDKKLSNLSGTVKVFVSSALKKFSTSDVAANSQKRKLTLKTNFSMTPSSYTLEDTNVGLGGGHINMAGKIGRGSSRLFQTNIEARNVLLEDAVAVYNQKDGNSIGGSLDALEAKLQGNMSDPLGSLQGNASFKSSQPIVKRFDLTNELRKGLAMIPLVGSRLSPDNLQEGTEKPTSEGNFDIANRVATFQMLTIKRGNYTVYAKGTLDFDFNVNLQAQVVFLQDTFSSLGFGFDQLGSVLGRAGRVSIPIFIRGQGEKASISPDMNTLLQDNSGVTQLRSVIDTSIDVGGAIGSFITRPFRGSKKEKNN